MSKPRTTPIIDEQIQSQSCTLDVRRSVLSRLPFFAELTADDIDRISAEFHERGFGQNETIYMAGDPARYLYVVAVGKVKLVRSMLSGQNVLLDILTPGDFFGALSSLGDQTYSDSAEAQTTCCALAVNATAFQMILRRYPPAALAALDIVSRRLQAAHDVIEQLSGDDIAKRIAIVLLRLADRVGQRQADMLVIQMPLSRQDLADMVGTTRETASRVISQLDRDAVIRSGRGWIGLLDLPRLAALAAGDAN